MAVLTHSLPPAGPLYGIGALLPQHVALPVTEVNTSVWPASALKV